MSRHRRTRIVLLLQDLHFGGTQRQALELARSLDPRRYQVELWMLMAGTGLVAEARRHGLTLRWLGAGGYVWPPALWRLWQRLRADRPDILVPLTGIPNIWGRIFGRLVRVPLVIGACRDHVLWHERWLGRLAHHHVCNSAAIRDYAISRYGLDPGAVSVIPNGVDLGRFAQAPPPQPSRFPVILTIGRLVADKDQAGLIDAFARIAADLPEVRLWIVGDGPLETVLKRMAFQTAWADRIRIFPGQADVTAFLRQAAVFALGSRRESLPNVVLEAMACGLPVVATDVGGLDELVVPGKTGLLVPPGRPVAMARALKALLVDPAKARDLGRAGRQRAAARFALTDMVRRYETLFDRWRHRRATEAFARTR